MDIHTKILAELGNIILRPNGRFFVLNFNFELIFTIIVNDVIINFPLKGDYVRMENYINLSNNDLSLVLHCGLREYYAYKKASKIALYYLEESGYNGILEMSLDTKMENISMLISLANFRMIKSDVTEDMVHINVSNVVFVLREIMYNYIGRIRALGYDPYNINIDVNDRIEEIKNYFDGLITRLNEEELVLKREKI